MPPKKSLRYGKEKEEILSANISYTKKAKIIQERIGLDSKQAAIEMAIDLLFMQVQGDIVRIFKKEDLNRLKGLLSSLNKN